MRFEPESSYTAILDYCHLDGDARKNVIIKLHRIFSCSLVCGPLSGSPNRSRPHFRPNVRPRTVAAWFGITCYLLTIWLRRETRKLHHFDNRIWACTCRQWSIKMRHCGPRSRSLSRRTSLASHRSPLLRQIVVVSFCPWLDTKICDAVISAYTSRPWSTEKYPRCRVNGKSYLLPLRLKGNFIATAVVSVRDILKPRPHHAATMSKQHCRMLQVERFFRQCWMLLRQSRTFDFVAAGVDGA